MKIKIFSILTSANIIRLPSKCKFNQNEILEQQSEESAMLDGDFFLFFLINVLLLVEQNKVKNQECRMGIFFPEQYTFSNTTNTTVVKASPQISNLITNFQIPCKI